MSIINYGHGMVYEVKIWGKDFDTNDKHIHSPETLRRVLDHHIKQEERMVAVFKEQPYTFFSAEYFDALLEEARGRSIYRAINNCVVEYLVAVKTKEWGWNALTNERVHTWRHRWDGDIVRELVDKNKFSANPIDREPPGLLLGHIVNGNPFFYDYVRPEHAVVACKRLGLNYEHRGIIYKQAGEMAQAAQRSKK